MSVFMDVVTLQTLLGLAVAYSLQHPEEAARRASRPCRRLKILQDAFMARKSCPVISFGCSKPSMPNTVGEMSCNEPPGRRASVDAFSLTTMNGTGFVVCAVCGPPVAGSIIISALP